MKNVEGLLLSGLAAPGTPMPPPPMPPPPAAAKKSKLPLLVTIFAVLGVVFMGMSLIMPWYSVKYDMSGVGTSEGTYSFSGVDTKVDITMAGQKISSSNHTAWGDMNNVDKTKSLYGTTQLLVILGLVMCILLLVGGVMLMKGPEKKMLVTIFGVLALVFTLLAPVVLMAMHPGAVKEDTKSASGTDPTGNGPFASFTGSTDSTLMGKMTWGPAIGWIMALLGFIFALLGFVLVLLVKKPAPAA
jgi:preprotein translocase subunit SecG/multisubunit Na+/H+ antiporter MnhG subunit